MNHHGPLTVTRSLAAEGVDLPPVEFGLCSVILGAIGLCLFFVPVIAIPICVAGVMVGLGGMVTRFFDIHGGIRLSVAGIVLSTTAFAMATAIGLAPDGYFRPREIFPSLSPAAERPYVPPPAAPNFTSASVSPYIGASS